MIVILFAALLPATIISKFYFDKMNSFMEDKVKTYNIEIIKQSGGKIETLISQIQSAKYQITSTSITSEVFKKTNEKTSIEAIQLLKKTETLIQDIKRSFPFSADIYLVGKNSQVYSSSSVYDRVKLLKKDWILRMQNINYGDIVLPTHHADYYNINNESDKPLVVSFVKKITIFGENSAVGIIQIDLNYSEIKNIMDNVNIGEDSAIIIMNSKNELIYCSKESNLDQYIGKKMENKKLEDLNSIYSSKKGLVVNYQIKNTDWKVSAYISNHNALVQQAELNTLYIFIIIISIVFSFLLSYVLSIGITNPITRLIKTMKKVGQGEFNTTTLKTNNKDLVALSDSFNIMINKIDNLMKNVVDKEKEKVNAQLKALQAQINPHFLYNTLEVVRSIAIDYNADSIAEISKALAKMFRYSINKDKEIVPLEEEIEHIRNYIRIQKYRFPNKFEVIYNIRKDMYNLKIIKFILQPLVENAVYHGIELKMDYGMIIIRGTRTYDTIYLQVIDNGLGMTKEKVDKINREIEINSLESDRNEQSDMGIGIINVNARIKLFYGDKYGLNLISEPSKGTTVNIKLPAIF